MYQSNEKDVSKGNKLSASVGCKFIKTSKFIFSTKCTCIRHILRNLESCENFCPLCMHYNFICEIYMYYSTMC